MKRKIYKLLLLVIALNISFILSGCSGSKQGQNDMQIGYWETKNPDLISSFEELSTKDTDYLKSFENKYIRVTFELSSLSITNGIYYMVSVASISTKYKGIDNTGFKIYATSNQNYWDIPYEEGDMVVVEGYLYKCEEYIAQGNVIPTTVYLYINPAIVSKK